MPEPHGGDKRRAAGLCVRSPCRTVDAGNAVHATKEQPMEWDEVKPKPKPGAAIGENLEAMSVAELEARIADLEREIARVKMELDAKRRHENAASALFKR